MGKKGVVNIRGKQYKTVVMRVNEFRENFSPSEGWAIQTWLISNEDDRVIIRATISDKDDHVVATGFAEEVRGSTNINKTSALENCETSAIGRALAAFGLGGEEYCSADELVSAISQQEAPEQKVAETEPKRPPEPEKPKFDPRARCEKWLDKLAELVGMEEANVNKINMMKHSDYSEGRVDLCDVRGFDNLRELGDEFKEMYLTTKKNREKEEE